MAGAEIEARQELGGLFHDAVTDHADVMAECESNFFSLLALD